MVRRRLRALALLLVLLGAVVAGCGGGDDGEPDGAAPDGGGTDPAALLARSADAMREVSTTAFTLQTEGDVAVVPVQAAEGSLTRDGAAQGTATTTQLGTTLELRFVVVGGSLYLEGPTGGYQQLPAGSLYDPSVILDGERGIPALLEAGTEPALEGTEEVDGVGTQRVRARFPGALLSALVPGLTTDTVGQVWITTDDDRTVRVRFPAAGGTVTVGLSDFDAPVDITAPV